MFFAVAEIVPRTVYGIRQHALRIMTVGFAVGLHRVLERMAFIESVPAEYLNPQKSSDVAHPDLGAEFHWRVLLPPDYRTYPGLTETDDAVINPGAAGIYGFHKVRTLVRFAIDNGEFKDLEVIELAEENKKG